MIAPVAAGGDKGMAGAGGMRTRRSRRHAELRTWVLTSAVFGAISSYSIFIQSRNLSCAREGLPMSQRSLHLVGTCFT